MMIVSIALFVSTWVTNFSQEGLLLLLMTKKKLRWQSNCSQDEKAIRGFIHNSSEIFTRHRAQTTENRISAQFHLSPKFLSLWKFSPFERKSLLQSEYSNNYCRFEANRSGGRGQGESEVILMAHLTNFYDDAKRHSRGWLLRKIIICHHAFLISHSVLCVANIRTTIQKLSLHRQPSNYSNKSFDKRKSFSSLLLRFNSITFSSVIIRSVDINSKRLDCSQFFNISLFD